jgi:nucleotide-binding universal stress UspA family protein
MFDHVLIGIRVGHRAAGLDALALATELVSPDGSLTLANINVVAPKPAPDSGLSGDAARRRSAVEELRELRDEVDVQAEVLAVDADSVRRGLHELAAARRADLIVIGATDYDQLDRVLVGDDARGLLEGAPCPVAVAPRGVSATAAALSRIGVGYDGSDGSEQALAVARKLAAERGARISVFQAITPPLHVRNGFSEEQEVAARVAEARKTIGALDGVAASAESADGLVEGLERFGASVDLLILGPHPRRLADRLFNVDGSTSQRLADDAACPLLVLPSRGPDRRP